MAISRSFVMISNILTKKWTFHNFYTKDVVEEKKPDNYVKEPTNYFYQEFY